jgi:hypothetical protein
MLQLTVMKKITHRWRILFLLVLTACAGASTPATTVENYFRALVGKDSQKVIGLSCAAWESSARIDADTFSMYPATLEAMACRDTGTQGDVHLIQCTGKAILDYNGEKQAVDLSARVYKVIREGGDWRMCGYQ